MSGPIVPPEHLRVNAHGLTKGEDALHVSNREVTELGILREKGVEESGWRKLPLVTHYNHLSTSGYRSQSLHRLDLTCLVDEEKIELDVTGPEELGHRHR